MVESGKSKWDTEGAKGNELGKFSIPKKTVGCGGKGSRLIVLYKLCVLVQKLCTGVTHCVKMEGILTY